MTKENKTNDDVVAVESKWDFLKRGSPDFLKAPMKGVIEFIKSLPFLTEEQKQAFLDKIKSLREGKPEEN